MLLNLWPGNFFVIINPCWHIRSLWMLRETLLPIWRREEKPPPLFLMGALTHATLWDPKHRKPRKVLDKKIIRKHIGSWLKLCDWNCVHNVGQQPNIGQVERPKQLKPKSLFHSHLWSDITLPLHRNGSCCPKGEYLATKWCFSKESWQSHYYLKWLEEDRSPWSGKIDLGETIPFLLN